MEHTISKSCSPDQTVEIVFHNKVDVHINDRETIALPSPARKSLRFNSGTLSVQKDTITLRYRSSQVPTKLTGAGGVGAVCLRLRKDSQVQENEILNVQKIEVFDRVVYVVHSAEGSQTGSTSFGTNSGGTVPDRNPDMQAENAKLKQECAKFKQDLAKASEIMNGLRSSVKDLCRENEKLKKENTGLNRAVEAGIDQIIENSRNGQLSLSPTLQQKLDELERLQQAASDVDGQIEQAQRQIGEQTEANIAAAARLQELQNQLAELRGQEEVTSLDCTEASEELKALRTRLQMNGDIAALTESRWLKNNSVNETMKEMKKKMDAVEERIGFILKAREVYHNAVQSAVLLGGDGTISANDESGNADEQDSAEGVNNTDNAT